MNGFIANLNIIDELCAECSKDVLKTNVTISNSLQSINLQCCYTLNVIDITDTFVTVLVTNGRNVVIRNVFTNSQAILRLPSIKCKHIVTLSTSIVRT